MQLLLFPISVETQEDPAMELMLHSGVKVCVCVSVCVCVHTYLYVKGYEEN